VCWGERSDEVRVLEEGDKRSSRGGMDDAVVGRKYVRREVGKSYI
jgi:hypothetical protein